MNLSLFSSDLSPNLLMNYFPVVQYIRQQSYVIRPHIIKCLNVTGANPLPLLPVALHDQFLRFSAAEADS